MKLNKLEFFLMNNPVRALIQEKYELPLLLKDLSSEKFDSLLEIGCGNGTGTRLLKKHLHPLNMTAIDLDERMIRIARAKDPHASTTYRVMDASKLDFPDATFDAVVDFGIIHHIPNWKDCVSELKRVLAPGGKLLLEDLSLETFSGFPGILGRRFLSHPYEQMYSTQEFVRHLEAVGFTIDSFQESNPLGMIKHFNITATVE